MLVQAIIKNAIRIIHKRSPLIYKVCKSYFRIYGMDVIKCSQY